MKAVLQRTTRAKVNTGGQTVGQIDCGIMVLLGVMQGDSEKEAAFLADKIANMRIFSDDNGKMNLSLLDIGGGLLIVSNFTLGANAEKGRRPSFVKAAKPPAAEALYEYFIGCAKNIGVQRVQSGVFGSDMQISFVNDGPVTIIVDTDEIMRK